MYGSHSTPFIMTHSAFAPGGGHSFMNVGKHAPPMPTTPAFFILSTISSGVSSGWSSSFSSFVERSIVSSHSSPSTATMTAGLMYPDASMALSTFVTVPETDENIGALTNPPASAIIVPTFTLSPLLTIGLAGAPMCWLIGNIACLGSGAGCVALSWLSLFSSGCMPPILNVRTFIACLLPYCYC